MHEGDKTDRGVIFAATLLQLMGVPFILLTSILFVAVLIIPFGLVKADEIDQYTFLYRISVYAACLLGMVICFIFTSGMMVMASMMKANHLTNKHQLSPKARLYVFTDNLLMVIGLQLVLGSSLGGFSAYVQGEVQVEGFQIGEVVVFLSVLFFFGIAVFVFRNYFLSINWWRTQREE